MADTRSNRIWPNKRKKDMKFYFRLEFFELEFQGQKFFWTVNHPSLGSDMIQNGYARVVLDMILRRHEILLP